MVKPIRMDIMKKLYAILLVMMLSISLVACGKGKEEEDPQGVVFEQIGAEGEAAEEAAKELLEAQAAATEAQTTAETEAPKETTAKAAEESSKEASTEATSASSEAATEASSEAAAEATSAEQQTETAAAETDKKTEGYGRILFVGDSRTVDMFSAEAEEIRGGVYNGIPVYCKNGCKYQYMVDAVNEYGMDNFDTLVSWMGCNDFGEFSPYGPYYDQLIAAGKQVVVCTVGPTQDEYLLDDMDWYYYPNANQIKFNNSLVSWANSKGVKIIDLYTYISNSSTVNLDPNDGIHYLPQPTTELWSVIRGSLK